MLPLFLGSVGLPELAVIFLILLLIFGGTKVPQLMKGLGQGISNFRRGVRELDDGDD